MKEGAAQRAVGRGTPPGAVSSPLRLHTGLRVCLHRSFLPGGEMLTVASVPLGDPVPPGHGGPRVQGTAPGDRAPTGADGDWRGRGHPRLRPPRFIFICNRPSSPRRPVPSPSVILNKMEHFNACSSSSVRGGRDGAGSGTSGSVAPGSGNAAPSPLRWIWPGDKSSLSLINKDGSLANC